MNTKITPSCSDEESPERVSLTMDQVLLEIAQLFNQNGLRWAVGASLVLKRHKLVPEAHDIDLLIDESHIASAVKLLDQRGMRLPIPESVMSDSVSKYFYKYQYKGVDLDLMAGFTIRHSEGVYWFTFDNESVGSCDTVNGIQIFYTTLEDWMIAYSLMDGREKKAELVYGYLISEGVRFPNLVNRAMQQNLPRGLVDRLNTLMNRESD